MSVKYTAQQKEWLIEHWDEYHTYDDLTSAYNECFGTSRTKTALIQQGVKVYKLTPKGHPLYVRYSQEELQFIKDNYFSCNTYEELRTLVNDKFHTNRTHYSIKDVCLKTLRLSNNHMHNMGNFGHRNRNQLPIGTIRVATNGTYIKVKMREPKHSERARHYDEPYWKPIQKKIYEDAYGEIADNQMICFLDGNRENLSLDNLYAIDRKISAILSHYGWWSKDRDITLAAIKFAELHYAVKDAENI